MDIIGAIERNPKIAAALIAGMAGINIVTLSVSGVYVHSVNKACKETNESLEDVKNQLNKLNNLLEAAADDDEEDEDTEK